MDDGSIMLIKGPILRLNKVKFNVILYIIHVIRE